MHRYGLTVSTPDASGPADASDRSVVDATGGGLAFADLGLDAAVLKALKDVGYETPVRHPGRDDPAAARRPRRRRPRPDRHRQDRRVRAADPRPASTSSQKTPQALVLAPTRELALQVCEAFESYAVAPEGRARAARLRRPGLRRAALGAAPRRAHRRRHPRPHHGPPRQGHARPLRAQVPRARRGRRDAEDGLRRGRRDDPRRHPRRPSRSRSSRRRCRRRSAASRSSTCTTPKRSRSRRRPRPRRTPPSATSIVSYPQKIDALTRILEVENFEGMIVFVRTKNETETLAEKLRARGYSAAAINGDVAQAQRERTVNQLKSGKLDILVATDVAARGLDVERISHVVNFDIPIDTESYVHRIGRTGRAGRIGRRDQLRHAARAPPAHRDRAGHPPAAHPDAAAERRRRQRHAPRPLRRRDHRGARADATRIDAVPRHHRATTCEHHDVPEADVAAALAVVAQGETPLLLVARRRPAAARRARRPRATARRPARPGRPRRPRQQRPARAPAAAARWRRTASRSASGTRWSRARSSARSRTRAASAASDFGAIQIRPDFSLVELPADLPARHARPARRHPDQRQAHRAAPRHGRPPPSELRPLPQPAAGQPASRAPYVSSGVLLKAIAAAGACRRTRLRIRSNSSSWLRTPPPITTTVHGP